MDLSILDELKDALLSLPYFYMLIFFIVIILIESICNYNEYLLYNNNKKNWKIWWKDFSKLSNKGSVLLGFTIMTFLTSFVGGKSLQTFSKFTIILGTYYIFVSLVRLIKSTLNESED